MPTTTLPEMPPDTAPETHRGDVPPVGEFVRELVGSGLLSAPEVERHLAAAPAEARVDAERLLNHLLARGVLTRFQAERLARRQPQGLTVGPYQLLTPVGRGGMGIVYLARAAAAAPGEAPVALKILPPSRAKREPRALTRFRRELDIGRRIPPHPHLAATLGGGEADGVHYLALEYAPGPTLRQQVRARGTLTVGEAARLFVGLAEGLQALHGAGVVHRDVKPGNVVVTPGGAGKLLDFGFALVLGEPHPRDPAILGGPGTTLGTADYLPPEQAADAGRVGPAADLYALGCCLHFALTGGVPYPGGGGHDKMRRHRHDAIPDLHAENPTVPAEFARLVTWAMAKRPGRWPASAAEFAGHLRPWADPAPAPTPPADWRAAVRALETGRASRPEAAAEAPAPGTKSPRRRRAFALATAACGAVVLAAFALGYLLARV